MDTVYTIFVLRIDADILKIERTIRYDLWIVGDQFPLGAAIIVLLYKPFFCCFHQSIHTVWLVGREGQADLAVSAIGRKPSSLPDFFPILAAVNGQIQAASGAATFKIPWGAAMLPHARQQAVGVGRVHYEIAAAGCIVGVQDLCPGVTASSVVLNTPLSGWMP